MIDKCNGFGNANNAFLANNDTSFNKPFNNNYCKNNINSSAFNVNNQSTNKIRDLCNDLNNIKENDEETLIERKQEKTTDNKSLETRMAELEKKFKKLRRELTDEMDELRNENEEIILDIVKDEVEVAKEDIMEEIKNDMKKIKKNIKNLEKYRDDNDQDFEEIKTIERNLMKKVEDMKKEHRKMDEEFSNLVHSVQSAQKNNESMISSSAFDSHDEKIFSYNDIMKFYEECKSGVDMSKRIHNPLNLIYAQGLMDGKSSVKETESVANFDSAFASRKDSNTNSIFDQEKVNPFQRSAPVNPFMNVKEFNENPFLKKDKPEKPSPFLNNSDNPFMKKKVDRIDKVTNPFGILVEQRPIKKLTGTRQPNHYTLKFDDAYQIADDNKSSEAPKRPVSSYFQFCKDERLKTESKLTSKELSGMWKNLDPEVKDRYSAKS